MRRSGSWNNNVDKITADPSIPFGVLSSGATYSKTQQDYKHATDPEKRKVYEPRRYDGRYDGVAALLTFCRTWNVAPWTPTSVVGNFDQDFFPVDTIDDICR